MRSEGNSARPVRSRRRWATRVLGCLALVLVLVALDGGVTLAQGALWYPRYWRDRAAEPVPPGAIRMIAFGDSAVEGIGARRPEEGFVGRIAEHLEQTTGRPVHVTNLSLGGGGVGEVLRDQVPGADLASADLVVVAAVSNDIGSLPLDRFRTDLTALLAALPAEKTVLSDAPLQAGWEPYQAVLAEVADRRGVRRADFAGVFTTVGRRLDIFAMDFTHLNSTGYEFWFEAFRPQVDAIVSPTDHPQTRQAPR